MYDIFHYHVEPVVEPVEESKSLFNVPHPHFSDSEITCNLRGNYGEPIPESILHNIEPTIVILELIREYVGKPIYINSSYRCPLYNKSVRGAKFSEHVNFKAIDFSIAGHGKQDYVKLAFLISTAAIFDASLLGGVGRYNNFLHIDCGRRRNW